MTVSTPLSLDRTIIMSDNHSKETRSYNMSKIKSTENKLETLVRRYLFSRGLRYRKNDKRYPGLPDIVFPKYRVVVFINGCFWHMHDGCRHSVLPKSNTEYWIPKLQRNHERYKNNVKLLEEAAWRVITVWECELEKDISEQRLNRLYGEITGESGG